MEMEEHFTSLTWHNRRGRGDVEREERQANRLIGRVHGGVAGGKKLTDGRI